MGRCKKNLPQQWVIVEAVEAHTKGDKRIIENIQIVECFGEDNNSALRQYVQLHKVHPEKEYYVVHTSRPELNVKERLPLSVLKQCGIDSKVELEIKDNCIMIKPVKTPRQGWDNAFKLMHKNGDDSLLVPKEIDDETLEDCDEPKY